MIRSFVIARSENNVIGCETGVPWSLPTDLKLFRLLTLDHPIIMGRKTFDSIGRPLDRRDNIVVTRDTSFCPKGVIVARDACSALEQAEMAAERRGVKEIMIIGGAEIFRLFEDVVDLVYLTEVRARVTGNAYFSKDFENWIEKKRIEFGKSERDQYPFTFRLLINRESKLVKEWVSRVTKRLERLPLAA
jgi:dihydrofolate reductase